MKIIAFKDGKEKIEYELSEKELTKLAVSPSVFKNPKNGTRNYSEDYMKKNCGSRVVNLGNGIYQIWNVQNMDSFFATSLLINLDGLNKTVSYINMQRIKGLYNSLNINY